MKNSCYVTMLNDLNEEVEFSVDYEYTAEKDPYGTGDSPTAYLITWARVSLDGNNITSFLRDDTLDYIDEMVYDDILSYFGESDDGVD